MGVGRKILSRAVEAYLGEGARDAERKVRQAVRQTVRKGERRFELFHRVDDPHSHLLLQLLGPLLDATGAELDVHVVPRGTEDVEPEPLQRAEWAIADAKLLAWRHGLSFPGDAEKPAESGLRRAHAITLRPRPARRQIEVAIAVGEALWADDHDRLAALAQEHGEIDQVGPALRAHADVLHKRGHYQGGMLHYEGEWYWGIDRWWHLRRRLEDEGVTGLRTLDEPAPAPSVGEVREIEVFFSFRSPYSYLALERLRPIAEEAGVPLVLRPVLPMVARGYEVPREKRLYIVRDSAREARRHGVPFGRIVDPLGTGIERCMACFEVAAERGLQVALASTLARGIWAEARDVASDDDLAVLVERAGLSWSEVRSRLRDQGWRAKVKANRERLGELGLWGVPVIRVGELSFWGQDRLDFVAAILAAR